MLPHEILGLLGLAQRAGKVIVGSTAVAREMRRSRQAMLVIFARDFSPATKKRLLAQAARPPHVFEIGSMQEWGECFGRQQVGVIAVVDKNFTTGLLQKLKP
jgi:ribosomal protein L7Ae-like RNA K-turn-binding protein